jgi:hypothetical protein
MAAMADKRREVARLNVERFERMLEAEPDPAKRAMLEELLKEAVAEHDLAAAEADLEDAARKASAGLQYRARQWRAKAEECRTTAESLNSASARDVFLRLASSYDLLADRMEGPIQPAERHEPKAG